jgi:hypothetical protein
LDESIPASACSLRKARRHSRGVPCLGLRSPLLERFPKACAEAIGYTGADDTELHLSAPPRSVQQHLTSCQTRFGRSEFDGVTWQDELIELAKLQRSQSRLPRLVMTPFFQKTRDLRPALVIAWAPVWLRGELEHGSEERSAAAASGAVEIARRVPDQAPRREAPRPSSRQRSTARFPCRLYLLRTLYRS